jgi:PAS domain S-box-containing protein
MRDVKTAGATRLKEAAPTAPSGSAAILLSLETFGEIAQTLRGIAEVPAICDRVVEILKARLGLDTCSIMLLDLDGETLVNVAGTAPRAEGGARPARHHRFRLGEGIAGLVAQTGEAVLVPDARQDARFRRGDTPTPVRSLLCLPILGAGAPIGVLNLSHPRPGFFAEDHRTVFGILATLLGRVLSEVRLTEALARFNRDLETQVADRTREIQASHAYLERILSQASDIVLTVDWRGCITFVNPRIAQLGYTADEVLGRPFSALCRGGALPAPLVDAMAGRVARNVELALAGRDGGRIDTYCGFAPLTDAGGGEGALVLVRDVTETKRLGEKLRQVEKLTAVGTLVAGIAHEINNKLVPILVYSELLERAELTEKEARLVQTIHKSAVGARHIMDSLLRFSRQETPHKTAHDLNEVVREVLGMVRYRVRKREVALVEELADDLPRARMDAHQIGQVVLNIVGNACDAVEAAGGTVTVRTGVEGGNLRLVVEDDGPGIDEATQGRIFDPFFTTKEVGKGTGLGLSLCYGIMQEHGGDIRVESRPGRTRFEVRLPCTPDPETEPGAAADGPAPARRGRKPGARCAPRARVLVADADPALLEVLAHVLGGRHEVAGERTARAALARLEADAFDAVLIDPNLPDRDGREVLAWIAEHRPALRDRVVVMGAPESGARDAGAPAGAAPGPRLSKPFRATEALEALDAVLGTGG